MIEWSILASRFGDHLWNKSMLIVIILLVAILLWLIVGATRTKRLEKIQRAAAMAAGVNLDEISRWRCKTCRFLSKKKPEYCIRCKGVVFEAE
jgi:hypothetical protein